MGSICFFPKCVPKIRDFVVFPFTRTREFENWWIKSGWVNAIPLSKLPSKILICEEHFEKDLINRRYKVPRLALGALPTRNVECPANTANPSSDGATQNNAQNVKRESYCRLCGQAQTTHISNEPDLLLKLDKIFQHQLHLSDSSKLPVGVCYSCKETANGIQAFWKTCTQAQETLKAIFSKPRVAKCPEPTEAAIATKSIQESSNLEGGIFATKESFPAECEEIVIDTTSTQVTEEQFANEYEFESYGEELPAGTAEESEEVIELTEPDNQLISDDYSIDYGDDSSSEEFTGNLSSSNRGEYRAPVKKDATTPITETKHICEVCGNAFKSLNGLKAHLLVHSERRDHQCTICGHEFKQRRALVEHIESKHERKTFPCKICGMPYSWKKGLQRHMNTHKGNTLKHVCKVCGKAFPVPHKLKLHMMLHTGDRIHCEFCGKGYRFNYMLTQHKIRVHNMVIEGVKLYSTPKQKRLGDRKK
ncbi:AGAP004081-PA [Anopheles gambiae str. PEST]|uniref:AGAP004081-PA n=1 Tax=Anopheles gambiae TaxID=7165 RepID=Q7PSL7_ANOGA|nr:AGAP004081-PA [Anopheles gambiae str. PEST]